MGMGSVSERVACTNWILYDQLSLHIAFSLVARQPWRKKRCSLPVLWSSATPLRIILAGVTLWLPTAQTLVATANFAS
jgi:hypothetical protein